MIDGFLKKRIKTGWVLLLLGGIVAARLLIAWSQRAFLTPESAPLDDMLMIRAAMSLAEGNWLGDYTGIAVAKNMGFAFWLYFVHLTGLPLLIANALLWLAAAGFSAQALRPLFSGNLSRAILFGALALMPVAYDHFTMRVYRDSVFPAFCLMLFAGVLGIALRLYEPGGRGSVLCGLGAGAGLAGSMLMREDGLVILVFALCGLGLALLYLLLRRDMPKKLPKVLGMALPFAVYGAAALAFCAGNFLHFGVFMVNDMNSGAFPGAYGAMMAVSEGESGYRKLHPVSREAIDRMYEEVPSFALLQPHLDTGPVLGGYGFPETGEYGGSLYYGLKVAADYAGLTPDAPSAQAYWAQVRAEIELAVAEGRLQSTGASSGVLPHFEPSDLGEVAAYTADSLVYLLTIQEFDPLPQYSIGPEDKIEPLCEFLNVRVQEGYEEGTDRPYLNPLQKLAFAGCTVLVWLYRVLIWPGLALGLFAMGRGLVRGVRQWKRDKKVPLLLLYGLLSFGLLLSVVLRVFVFAYMDVLSFDYGQYMLYLAGGMPPLLLFFAFLPGSAADAVLAGRPEDGVHPGLGAKGDA